MADSFLSAEIDASGLAAMNRLSVGGPFVAAELARALDAIAEEAIAIIQQNMHFDKGYATGELEGSLQIDEPSELERRVYTDNPHAEFVEYGTGQRGAASGVEPPDDYEYGARPGMDAEPYMAPSEPEIETFAEIRLVNAVAIALDGLAHG